MELGQVFDESGRLFDAGRYVTAMQCLVDALWSKRQSMSQFDWHAQLAKVREHPALKIAYRCPFTFHSISRPFGYPGDATLIDYIYGYKKPDLDDISKKIYRYTTGSPAPRAVRFRRYVLAHLVDQTLHKKAETASILSIACGHLRELDLSHGIKQIRPSRFIALDQDENSLAEVERCFGALGVTSMKKSIKELVAGRTTFEELDLIYAAGLYDYLNRDVAERLTQKLFQMLGSGGKLLIANFLPNIPDVGYMEAVMDWWLIYRDEKAVLALAAGIPEESIAQVRHYRDPDDNIVFLELWRK